MTIADCLKYLEFRKATETISKNHRYRHFIRTDNNGIVSHYWLGTHGGLRKGSSPSNSNSIQPVVERWLLTSEKVL